MVFLYNSVVCLKFMLRLTSRVPDEPPIVTTRLLSRNINWRQTTELYENKVFISI